jgi:hypothetical protein
MRASTGTLMRSTNRTDARVTRGAVTMRRALVAAAMLLCAASGSASAHQARTVGTGCHVPRFTGLTLSAARKRAAHAHCNLRVKGAALEQAEVQTIERQSPARGGRSSSVTVWLNPFCRREADYAPELKEPLVTQGPTELVSGFFLVGGPDSRRFSDRGCKLPAPPPGAGTVDVTNASGAVVATQTSTYGHFVEIPLPAGSYTITGTFLGATVNEVHPKESESVVIPAGHTVRQDFFLNIP